jgi:hypothetical protein
MFFHGNTQQSGNGVTHFLLKMKTGLIYKILWTSYIYIYIAWMTNEPQMNNLYHWNDNPIELWPSIVTYQQSLRLAVRNYTWDVKEPQGQSCPMLINFLIIFPFLSSRCTSVCMCSFYVSRNRIFCIYRSFLANVVYSLFSGCFFAAYVPSLYPEYRSTITVLNARHQNSDNHNVTCTVEIDLVINMANSVNYGLGFEPVIPGFTLRSKMIDLTYNFNI